MDTTEITPGIIVKKNDGHARYVVTVYDAGLNAANVYEIYGNETTGFSIVNGRIEAGPAWFENVERMKGKSEDKPSSSEIVRLLNTVLFNAEKNATDWRQQVREWENKWEEANDKLIEAAQENDLCEKFDEVAESIGMRGCKRDFDVTFTVSYSVTARVSARDEDDARDQVTEWEDSSYLDERLEETISNSTPEDINVDYVEEA